MKIRHERPMSDLSFQVRAPLTLELVDGKSVTINEWSLSGFKFPGNSDILPRQGILSIPFQGIDIQFEVKLEPGSDPRELIFEGLTGRQRETLAVFYRSILSGKMASTEEIITSLDTPVDLVPMGETEEEKAEGVKTITPRLLRVLWNGFVYSVLAFVVFGMVGTAIYDRLSGIQLQNGRVVSPLFEHRMSEDAFVERIFVKIGDEVKTGDLLVQLNSPERDGALDAVRIDIRQIENLIADAKWRLERLIKRREAYRKALANELALQIALRSEWQLLGGYNLDGIEAALSALRAFDEGIDPLALEFEEQEAQIRELLTLREDEYRQLKRDLSNTKDAYDAISVFALTDGVVRELPLIEDIHQARGTLAVIVEANAHREIVGWVNERAAQRIFVGQEARLRIATSEGSRSLNAEVIDAMAGVDPANPGDFGVMVTLRSDQTDLNKNRAELRPGAAVEIKVDRGWSLTPYVMTFRNWIL